MWHKHQPTNKQRSTENGSPSCVVLSFPEINYSNWACDSISTTYTILLSATDTPNITMTSAQTTSSTSSTRSRTNIPNTTTTSSVSSSSSLSLPATNSVSKSTNVGAIVGGVLGGIALTGLFLTFMLRSEERR